MRHRFSLAVGLIGFAAGGAPLAAQEDGALFSAWTAPSGQAVALYERVPEPEAAQVRYRFLAPELGGQVYDTVAADLPWLCANVALPDLRALGLAADLVVISLGDRVVPLGQMDAEAVQYFDAFRITDGTCSLEVF